MSPQARANLDNMVDHCLAGLGLMAMFVMPWLVVTRNLAASLLFGWAMQSAFWLGRERRDHEIDVQRRQGVELGDLQGWWVFGWSADGKRDLFAPVIFNLIVVGLIIWLVRLFA